MTLAQRQGRQFDARAQARGVNFKMLRFGESIVFTPNPIIHHHGVILHGEHTSALVDPEPFNTYVALIPKDVVEELVALPELVPNSKWYVSNDGGASWILLRQMGDINSVSPVRYHITLVERGV
jgi:hypothetical protein